MNESDIETLQDSAKRLSFYERFIVGDFGLAKTYWLFGAVPNLLANLALRNTSSYSAVYWIFAGLAIYQCLLLVAIWNAGKKYKGPRIWTILAFLIILLAVFRNGGAVLNMPHWTLGG